MNMSLVNLTIATVCVSSFVCATCSIVAVHHLAKMNNLLIELVEGASRLDRARRIANPKYPLTENDYPRR